MWFFSLIIKFHQELSFNSERNNYLSPVQQILIRLRFYATGTFQQVIGDLGQVTQATCWRAINQVLRCIAKLWPEVIYLPQTEQECKEISQAFYILSGFPCVL